MSIRRIGQLVREKAIITFVIGAIVGAVAFLVLYGVNVIVPTNVNWLTNSESLEGLWDLTQHYNGWLYYRQSAWSFPIGMMSNVCSEDISVAYTDSIPLFAIIFKILSPILPQSFQYFGIFELMTYMLMGGFGSLITYKYSKNVILNCISAGLFVVSPVLTKRVFFHSALSAHFLILIAICLWIYRDKLSFRKYLISWTLLGILCVLINPYYVPMVLGILLCSTLQQLICDKKILHNVCVILMTLICVVIVGWIIGLFSGSQSASGDSLELVSYNLNQLFNPGDPILHHDDKRPVLTGEVFNYSQKVNEASVKTGWQTEGFSYLGLGMIFMVVIAGVILVFYIEKNVNKVNKRKYISYFISVLLGLVVFTLLAMGPLATYADGVLYQLKLPDVLYKLFAMFRTCGRFIWPVYYGIYALSLIIFAKCIKGKRYIWILLLVCTLIQLVDISPSLIRKRNIYTNIGYNEVENGNQLLSSDIMTELAKNHDEIVFLPDTKLGICLAANWSCKFQQYALENGMKMSAAYCSRDVSETSDEYAEKILEDKRNGKNYPNVIYVVMYKDGLKRYEDYNIDFFEFNDIYIGVEK